MVIIIRNFSLFFKKIKLMFDRNSKYAGEGVLSILPRIQIMTIKFNETYLATSSVFSDQKEDDIVSFNFKIICKKKVFLSPDKKTFINKYLVIQYGNVFQEILFDIITKEEYDSLHLTERIKMRYDPVLHQNPLRRLLNSLRKKRK